MAMQRGGVWIKVALAVSLALNLAVGGAFLGAVWHGERVADVMPLVQDRRLMGLVAILPPDRRAKLRDEIGRGGPDGRAAVMEARDGFIAELRGPQADAARLAAYLTQAKSAQRERVSLVEMALAETLAAMPQEDRIAYADRLVRLDRAKGRRHRADGPRTRDENRRDK